MKRVILGLAASALAVAGHAATWTDISRVPGKSVTQLDTDSLRQIGPGQFSVTWRGGASMDKISAILVGTVDCASESFHLTSETLIEQNPSLAHDLVILAGNKDRVYDYVAGTVTWLGRPMPLSDRDKLARHRYPADAGEDNSIFHYLCKDVIPSTAQREAVSSVIQTKLGCNATPWKGTVLCQRDPKSLGALYSFTMRFEQAVAACSMPAEHASQVLRDWYQTLAECRDTGGCLPVMQLTTSGLIDDLAAATEHQPCTYLEQSLASAREHAVTRASITNFQACVTKQIPALDDLLSSADVIANAVYGACEGQLPGRMHGNPSIRGNSLPGISAEVLQFRRLLLKHQKLKQSVPKPKAYQTRETSQPARVVEAVI